LSGLDREISLTTEVTTGVLTEWRVDLASRPTHPEPLATVIASSIHAGQAGHRFLTEIFIDGICDPV